MSFNLMSVCKMPSCFFGLAHFSVSTSFCNIALAYFGFAKDRRAVKKPSLFAALRAGAIAIPKYQRRVTVLLRNYELTVTEHGINGDRARN